MAFESAKAMLGEAVLKQGLRYLASNPEKNLVNLVKWGEAVAREESHKKYARTWAEMFSDEKNNWRNFAIRLIRQTSPKVREKLGVNFFVNAGILCPARQREAEKKYGIHVPWALLIDPTGKCNLRCKGCWAAEYDRTQDMDYATLDRVLTEAEDLGIHFIVVSGGEPTVRMDDLISLASKHNESVFHVFTNGTLLTKEAAKKFAELGNVTFAISLEGFEESTDARRGKGVFQKIMAAMDNLREAGIVFGFSATYTRANTEEIASDRFIDLMIEKGCVLGWLFTYVPVGGGADLEYMATPEQRAYMYRQVQRWRKEKPIFVADFWNDGPAVGGCIAGGRNYFHINAMGDVEPCAFVHYANVNIKNTTLVEALKCPLFKAYQANQPFNENLMRPCPIIDNPEKLEKIVNETGAYPTQKNGVTATELCRPLYGYAEAWGKVADKIWAEMKESSPASSVAGDMGER
ncbi:MAG TPA: radical SAM protein [Firmicutes bacterium]|nr:radical SAM protein [Candidatus Fermentithermobacillaceae bacterium]